MNKTITLSHAKGHAHARAQVHITRTKRYANSFFPYYINHCETFKSEIKSSMSLQTFKGNINEHIHTNGPKFFNKHGMTRLT